MSRISPRGVQFAVVSLLCFWSLVSHPGWIDDATIPSEMILFLGFIYRWLWPEKISARGVWFAGALFICWYFGFYTEWSDNPRALGGMILFLCVFYGLLWPQKTIALHYRRQRGIVEIIPECSFRRVSERMIDQSLRKRIAAQPGAGAPRQ